jgi:hypothetical protein
MKFEIENKSLRDSNIFFRIEFEVDDTMYNQAVNATSKITDKTITTNDVKEWINQALRGNLQIQVFEGENEEPTGLFLISPKFFREEIKARILFTKGELARTIISEIEIAVAKRISGDAKKVVNPVVEKDPPKKEPLKEENPIPDNFSREIELESGTFSLKINCLLEIDKNKWANQYNELRALFDENPLNLLQKVIHNSTYNFRYKGIGTEINLKRVFPNVFVNQICSSVDVLPVPSDVIKSALNDIHKNILDEIERHLPKREELVEFKPFEMIQGALRFTFYNVNLNAKVLKNKENKTILQLLDEGLLKYAEVNIQDFWMGKFSNQLVLKNIDGATFAKTFRNILSYYELDTQEFINKFGEVFGVIKEEPQSNKVKFLLEKMAENRHKPGFFKFYEALKKELNLNED